MTTTSASITIAILLAALGTSAFAGGNKLVIVVADGVPYTDLPLQHRHARGGS